ncbi:caspase family protein [Nostoc sp. ChiVER01]|uniref:nSTAND1 domain-containing NTPase n=1 Tax=Nostoc sp. ChiVER01 TaxID=3075382 RepID=UPI002AD27440|nr:caspase family protein [Nostoc sp. ChiVER01]MDZ8226526.1 caspase family protein [Nostoc sp. ChiVER01]
MNRDALVVGINQYPFLKDTPTSKAKHLFTPANDAEAIAQRLEEYGDFRVRRLPETIQGEQRRVTSDGLVKSETLEDAIIQLFNPVGENIPETALLYFIGHGLRKNRGGVTEGFLAASDVDPRKNQWGVSLRWLRELLQKSPVKQQIVWLDCCYSGELFNFVEADLGTSLQEQTRFLIAASREFEFAQEDIQGKHGVFSKALWQGLDPRQQPDGLVNNDKLIEYIAQTLKDVPQQPIWYNPNREIMLTGEREDVLIHIPNGVCPYKGLRFFDIEDATYFYGREVLTQKLIQHVQVGKGNFLAVLGVSGSGKSSLLRAGLIYQLQQQRRLPGTEEWKIRIFSPGEQPLVSLATAFMDESATDMQRAEQLKVADEAIAQGETGLARLIRASRSPRTLLIVDQFEEIFTVCQSHSDRQQFISSLLGALKQTEDKLCIIFAMRDDFLGKCAAYHELTDLIQTNLVMVTPMSLEELQQAIREPAAKLGRKVEENLINAILKDLGVEVGQPTQEAEPGILPLLSYTLEQLWQRQKLNWLKLDSYHQLGGVRKTLENLAEQTYKELSPEEQRVTDLIFINLTQLGEGTPDTRKQVPQRDLVSLGKSAQLVQVIQKLALAKLIVTSEQRRGEEKVAVVDVAHEALIRHWSRLRELLDNNREAIRTERRIQAAAEEWEDKGKSVDYLLTGLRLAEAEKFLQEQVDIVPPSGLSRELIESSQKERDRQQAESDRRQKQTVIGLVFSLLMTAGFALMVSFQLWRVSEQLNANKLLENLKLQISKSVALLGTENLMIKKIAITDKMIWLAVYNNKEQGLGLWQYNLQTQQLVNRYLSNSEVSSLWTEGEEIWIGVKDQGVLHGMIKNGSMTFQLVQTIANKITIFSLVRDKQGRLWIGTDNGIYRESAKGWEHITSIQSLCKNLPNSSPKLYVEKIVINSERDILWMATQEGLIQWQLGKHNDSPECYSQSQHQSNTLKEIPNDLTALAFNDKTSILAIGSFYGDVSLILKKIDTHNIIDYKLINYPRLPDTTINDLAILPNNSILAVNKQSYVSLYENTNNTWSKLPIGEGKVIEIHTMILGKDKYLWLGTRKGAYRSKEPIFK